jgi:RimJ/RimL family protein N-acetyltransferase
MSDLHVRLCPLTEQTLGDLLEAAVADADPLEVMPPVAGPPGWNAKRRQAFLDFHRDRSIDTHHPVETTYIIVVADQVVGAARLEPTEDAVEAGVWIGRSHRGLGVGKAVMTQLLATAAETGAPRLIASTTVENVAAQRLLIFAAAELVTDGSNVNATLRAGHPGWPPSQGATANARPVTC